MPFHWELEFLEAFYDENGRRAKAGFDAIIGNPPYDVLSERETGHDLTALRTFIDHEPVYLPSSTGKNNLFKLFICRSLELLADGGFFGLITPMAILGDLTTAETRKQITRIASFTGIEAFPQKDNPKKRVFREAKLSTAVFIAIKGSGHSEPFRVRVHPGRDIEAASPSFSLRTEEIGLYDPENYAIVSCAQVDWDLAVRIMQTGRLRRLADVATSFQGEVNESNERRDRRISYSSNDGPEVIRGAHLCLYALREASQGTAVYLLRDRFLDRSTSSEDQKAFHHRYARVGFQRKSPQNNFRRLIAARIPQGTFLLESISYVPSHKCSTPLEMVLALLNSKLGDWYFRLGSTNAMVGEYQFNNLPFPIFRTSSNNAESLAVSSSLRAMHSGDMAGAFASVEPLLSSAPFSPLLERLFVEATERIEAIEEAREHVRRVDRSALDPHAQPYQDFIDRLFYAMAGISDAEARGLEERLARMQ